MFMHHVAGYMVLYTQHPDLPSEEWETTSVDGPETQASVGNLTLNVTYHLRVQARNSIGYSPLSSNTLFYTKPLVIAGLSPFPCYSYPFILAYIGLSAKTSFYNSWYVIDCTTIEGDLGFKFGEWQS